MAMFQFANCNSHYQRVLVVDYGGSQVLHWTMAAASRTSWDPNCSFSCRGCDCRIRMITQISPFRATVEICGVTYFPLRFASEKLSMKWTCEIPTSQASGNPTQRNIAHGNPAMFSEALEENPKKNGWFDKPAIFFVFLACWILIFV